VQGWIIRIAIVAVVVVGGLVFRDRLSGNAGDLKVGDCFDEPQGTQTVKDVQHHPCSEAHTGEVVFVGAVPGDNATYPGDAAFTTFAIQNCAPAFATYTGTAINAQTALDMSYFFPLADGWAKGSHDLTCYIIRTDGTAVSQSFKKAP
jgi:hypothetical protein